MRTAPPFAQTGGRIKQLREAKGLSRRDVAEQLAVDVTSIAGWEAGNRLPRDRQRLRLARLLGVELEFLFASLPERPREQSTMMLVDTVEELPNLLISLTQSANERLRALRLAAPYPTAAHVQVEWRNLVDEKLRTSKFEVQRVEIFYSLSRLQETLSNIFRYDGRAYHVKSYCAGITEVAPAMGGYGFDDDEFLLGAYWTGVPPHRRPGIRLSGQPFRTYFNEYWDEIWRRGTLLNIRGSHDLSAVQTVALKLGLRPKQWKSFVEDAKELKIGDGAPPLV